MSGGLSRAAENVIQTPGHDVRSENVDRHRYQHFNNKHAFLFALGILMGLLISN